MGGEPFAATLIQCGPATSRKRHALSSIRALRLMSPDLHDFNVRWWKRRRQYCRNPRQTFWCSRSDAVAGSGSKGFSGDHGAATAKQLSQPFRSLLQIRPPVEAKLAYISYLRIPGIMEQRLAKPPLAAVVYVALLLLIAVLAGIASTLKIRALGKGTLLQILVFASCFYSIAVAGYRIALRLCPF